MSRHRSGLLGLKNQASLPGSALKAKYWPAISCRSSDNPHTAPRQATAIASQLHTGDLPLADASNSEQAKPSQDLLPNDRFLLPPVYILQRGRTESSNLFEHLRLLPWHGHLSAMNIAMDFISMPGHVDQLLSIEGPLSAVCCLLSAVRIRVLETHRTRKIGQVLWRANACWRKDKNAKRCLHEAQ